MTVETDWIIAIAGGVTGVATVGLSWIAWYQLGALRKQLDAQATQLDEQARELATQRALEKQWRTIEVCVRYTYDPVLRECKQRLYLERDHGRLSEYPEPFKVKQDAVMIANYLDAIGTGVLQDVYVKEIVDDHLRPVIRDVVEKFVKNGWGKFGIDESRMQGLMHLYSITSAAKTTFKMP